MKSAQYPLRLLDDPELEAQVTPTYMQYLKWSQELKAFINQLMMLFEFFSEISYIRI